MTPPAEGSALAPIVALEPVRLMPLALVTIALVVVAVLFMTGGSLNIEGFTAVQGVTRALPDPFWSMVTLCGTGLGAFALLAPSLTRQPRCYAAAIVAAAFAGLYARGVKALFALPRPALVLDPVHLHVIGERLRHNSFPSGHTVTAFALAAVFVFASTRPIKTAFWALPFAALVATSRIAVGAHWPADLAAGAAGGWVCGALGVIVVGRWRRWNTIVGIRAMALVSIGIGVSLCVVDLGYPQAIGLQWLFAAVAIGMGGFVLARPRLDGLLPAPR
jgi:membrane-associated phospholipid phosphatase